MTEEIKPSETGGNSAAKEEEAGEKAEQAVEEKLEEVKISENKEKDENDNKEEPIEEPEVEKVQNIEDEEGVLDDDEIEENPAYIPKKGRYYMHDSRDEMALEDLESKKSRADGAWSHDRYVERWQQPKSKRQLVARYGFDIRHDETEQEAEESEKPVVSESPSRNGERSNQQQRGRGRGRRGGGRVIRGEGARESNEDHEGSGEEEKEDQGEDTRERGGSRRQRPSKPGVVRNVRGGRGQPSAMNTRPYRNQERPRNNGTTERQEREEQRDDTHEMPPRREKEEYLENHRRGVIRGAVRGFNAQPRQFVRTVNSSNRYDRGGRFPEPRREQQNGREMPSERRPSGGFTNRGRGVRGASRGSPRGGSNIYRGGSPPKRYPMPRHDGPPPPPPQAMGPPRGYAPRQEVVFFDHPAPPPPAAHQASPVVYFDPAAQQPNRPLPPREKKIIEIKSPN